MRLTLLHKGLLLMSIPLCFEISLVCVLLNLQYQVENDSKRVHHLLEIDSLINLSIGDVVSVAMSIGEYGSQGLHFQEISKRCNALHQHIASLRELTKDDPHLLRLVDRSSLSLMQAEDDMRATRAKVLSASPEEAKAALIAGAHKMDSDLMQALSTGLLELSADSARELSQDKTADMRHFIIALLKCAIALSVILGLVGAVSYSRHMVGRLARVRTNAKYLAAGKSMLVPLPGDDEISQLDQSFHRVAEVIERNLRREKAIVSNVRDIICSFDDRFRLRTINPAGEALLGQDAEALVGRSFVSLISDVDKTRVEEALQTVSNTATPAELSASITTGRNSVVQADLSVSYSADDRSYYAVIHDVTVKRQLEQVKQEVTAMITHDLRTPVQSIGNYLEMLKAGRFGEINERGVKLLGLVERESQRITGLIDGVLQLEKLRSGAVTLEKKVISMAAVLQNSADAVQLLAGQKSISIVVQQSEECVLGDAIWLEQIFVNVIANAVNYSPNGSQIQVQVRRTGRYAETFVIDQGPGISDDEKLLIFERFHRVAAGVQRVTGSGLGLTISKELAELHEGYIRVESTPGHGSTFIVGIPRTDDGNAQL